MELTVRCFSAIFSDIFNQKLCKKYKLLTLDPPES